MLFVRVQYLKNFGNFSRETFFPQTSNAQNKVTTQKYLRSINLDKTISRSKYGKAKIDV